MDRNRDFRSAVSTVEGSPRRRQRETTLRDSADEDKRMELKETETLRHREQLRKKEVDRDLSKRRRIEDRYAVRQMSGGENHRENTSMDSSDEDYFEEEVETRLHQLNRMNQLPPSPNCRGISTLPSSPVLRVAINEVLGVPVPRRARSAKKFHEHRNPGSGEFGEDLMGRKVFPSPSTVSPVGSGGTSTSSSGASMKKKMKSVQPSVSKSSTMIQDEIEIEVAEALFDLMKQSHSQSQSSEREGKVHRDGKDTNDDLKRLKAGYGKDETGAIKVHNELAIKEANNGEGIEKGKFPAEPVQELVEADRFVDRGKVEAAEDRESPSCVKVNPCDIQDPTVTKADYEPIVDEVGTKKGARMEIDLMAFPSVPSSPERDSVLDVNSEVVAQNVQEKCETSTNGETRMPNGDRSLNLNLEQQRHDTSRAGKSTTQPQQGPKAPTNQSPTSFLPFSIGIGSWPGVLPHLSYVASHQANLPVDGNAQSSVTMQALEFKLLQPRPKRSVTHRYIAENIHSHHQLVQKCLSSGFTDVGPMYGTKSSNLKLMLPKQRFIPRNPLKGGFERTQNLAGGARKDESPAVPTDNNVTMSAKSLLQQRPSQAQALASNFLHKHNPGFTLPLVGHHQAATMAPPSSLRASQSALLSNPSTKKPPANSSHVEASNAGACNGSFFRSNEAASYMAMLEHNGCQFPIPPNIALPSFKGGSVLSSSYYSPSLVFNIPPNQHLPTINMKTPENKMLQLEKKNDASAADGSASHASKPNNSSSSSSAQFYSFPIQPMSLGQIGNKKPPVSQPVISLSSIPQNSSFFQMHPELSWKGGAGNKNFPSSEEKSRDAPSSSSATPPSKFVNLGTPVGFLPSHLSPAPIPTFYPQQQQQAQPKGSPVKADPHTPLFLKWDHFPVKAKHPDGSSQLFSQHIPQPKNPQVLVQGHVANSNSPGLVLQNSSKSTSSSNQRMSTTVSALASQEAEGSQKSSPACRRTVPSILGTCPGQLPELKY